MKASIQNEQLLVTITSGEVDDISIEGRTIGTRYSHAFDTLPLGYTPEGKLTIAALSKIEEDVSYELRIVGGKLVWDTPRLIAQFDGGADLRLFVSESYFYNPQQDTPDLDVIAAQHEVRSPDVEFISRLIPLQGICLRRVLEL